MKYKDAIQYLNGFINFERLPEPRMDTREDDLLRFRRLLEKLESPQKNYPVVHIAGTKGKGSTAAILASILRTAGYSTGLYTSPHLITVRERLRIRGRMVSKREFASLISRIKLVSDVNGLNSNLAFRTVFEYLTAAALLWFSERKVDIAIIETGLGGRLDSTNVLDPVLTIHTPIGLDHTAVLGDTIAEIARDKAQIIKPGVPAVSAPQDKEAKNELINYARKSGSEITFARGADEFTLQRSGLWGSKFRVNNSLIKQTECFCNLPGKFQLDNISTVFLALEQLRKLGFEALPQSITTGLRNIRWQGRMQHIKGNPQIILDGSHNTLAVKALLDGVGDSTDIKNFKVVFSAMKGKPVREMLELLRALTEKLYLAPLAFPKGMSAVEMAKNADLTGCKYKLYEDIPLAFARAKSEAKDNEIIIATGSLYLVGEVLRYLKGLLPPPKDGMIDDDI